MFVCNTATLGMQVWRTLSRDASNYARIIGRNTNQLGKEVAAGRSLKRAQYPTQEEPLFPHDNQSLLEKFDKGSLGGKPLSNQVTQQKALRPAARTAHENFKKLMDWYVKFQVMSNQWELTSGDDAYFERLTPGVAERRDHYHNDATRLLESQEKKRLGIADTEHAVRPKTHVGADNALHPAGSLDVENVYGQGVGHALNTLSPHLYLHVKGDEKSPPSPFSSTSVGEPITPKVHEWGPAATIDLSQAKTLPTRLAVAMILAGDMHIDGPDNIKPWDWRASSDLGLDSASQKQLASAMLDYGIDPNKTEYSGREKMATYVIAISEVLVIGSTPPGSVKV